MKIISIVIIIRYSISGLELWNSNVFMKRRVINQKHRDFNSEIIPNFISIYTVRASNIKLFYYYYQLYFVS